MWVVRVTGDGWFGEKNLTLLLIEKESLAATGFDIRREREMSILGLLGVHR